MPIRLKLDSIARGSASGAAALMVCLALSTASAQGGGAQVEAKSAPATAKPAPATAKPASPSAKPAPAKPVSAAATAKAAARERFESAVRKLGASDVETVRAGMLALTEIKGAEAERALIERVQAGLPPALVDPALDALVALKSRRALPVMVELMQHRRALVRARALSAIAAIETHRGGATQTLLLSALEDPAEEVRSAAAEGLGRLGTEAAVAPLFAAHDRGVPTALDAIAQLAGRASVEAVLARMPQGVVDPVEPVLDRLLSAGKLAPGEQVKLARKLVAAATPSARQYLMKWLDRIKLDGHPAVKAELFSALKTLDSRKHVATTVATAPEKPQPAPQAPAQPAAAPAPVLAGREPAVAKEGAR